MQHPKKLILILILTTLSLVTLTGCNLFGGKTTPTPFVSDGEEEPFIGIPNPASFYCQEMGYTLDLRETDQGTEGICIFPNGAECEEWKFLGGGCAIEWTYCQRQGYIIREGQNFGICNFPDGSACSEYDFFIGECQPVEE